MSSPRHTFTPGRHTPAPASPEEAHPHLAETRGDDHRTGLSNETDKANEADETDEADARNGTASAPREITREGATWLTSAGTYPRTTLARWTATPTTAPVLPCGTAFDVVSAQAVFGRCIVDRLRESGRGPGPVAVHRDRMLLFAAPGTAHRLPSLLRWEEWGATGRCGRAALPPLLCHGPGDAVTVPPLAPGTDSGPRWMIAPRTRRPWLPGPDVLLWACVRAVRAAAGGAVRISIFPGADLGANVYDVSRRR